MKDSLTYGYILDSDEQIKDRAEWYSKLNSSVQEFLDRYGKYVDYNYPDSVVRFQCNVEYNGSRITGSTTVFLPQYRLEAVVGNDEQNLKKRMLDLIGHVVDRRYLYNENYCLTINLRYK